MKRLAANDDLEFMRGPIPLTFHDPTGKDNVLEIQDGKTVVLEFVGCMDGDQEYRDRTSRRSKAIVSGGTA